jgi:hypothetical protein
MPLRLGLVAVCSLSLIILAPGALSGAKNIKDVTRPDDERELTSKNVDGAGTPDFVDPGDSRRLMLDDYRTWLAPVEKLQYANDDWYPYPLRPPFGVDEGVNESWMVQAGAARISARPGASAPQIPAELKIPESPGSRPAFYVVHFEDTIRTEWKQAVISAGAVSTEGYLPNNALVFFMGPEAYQAVSGIPEVDWIGYYEPAYKIDPLIGKLPIRPDTRASDAVFFTVTLHGGVDPEAVVTRLESLGLTVLDDIQAIKSEKYAPRSYKPWKLTVSGERTDVLDMARMDEILYVAEAPTVKKRHAYSVGGILQSGDSANWASLGTSEPPATSASYFPLWVTRNLRGQHQMVGICDGGVDYGYDSLFGQPVNPLMTTATNGPDLKFPAWSDRDGTLALCADVDTDGNGTHGTGCAGSCCQDWHSNSLTESYGEVTVDTGAFGEGIAHEAQIVFATDGGYTTGLSYQTQRLQWLDLADYGASVISASWSWRQGATFTYDDQSALLDDIMDSNEYVLIVTSGGNEGTCPTFDTANDDSQTISWSKNPVDVGASDDLARWDRMLNHTDSGWQSNLGPDWSNPPGSTADDLIFPDVVASGADSGQLLNEGTIVAGADGTCNNADGGDLFNAIQLFGGTSAAAPHVAGAVALIHQYFEEGYYPQITDPTGALMKAMLINSTEPMGTTCSGSGRPGGDQGWGRPNLSSSLAFSGVDATPFVLNAYDVLNASGFSASGQSQDYVINITNTSEPLKITLAWTDVPSLMGSTRPYLVNNLDLELIKGGTTYYGNNFDTSTGYSTSTTTATDGANAVENIFLSASQVAALGTGTATVRITMANDPTGRNQGYGLVVVGGLEPPTDVYFDKQVYSCADTVVVTAVDYTPSGTAVVTSPSGDSETVTLSSIGNDRYQGTLLTGEGDTTPDNGTLGITHGDSITVTYETIYTDTSDIGCSMDLTTYSISVSGGCDVWDSTAPTLNTGEKYGPYLDTDELVTITYIFLNNGTYDIFNAWAELTDSSGCLTIYGDNPTYIGTLLASDIAGVTWTALVGSCAQRTDATLTLTLTADGYPEPAVLSDVTTMINADDVITEYNDCYTHTSADVTSLTWGSGYDFTNIGWTRSTSATCGYEDRTDGDCDDATAGMYKQLPCGAGSIPANSAGALVPPSPIPLFNNGDGPGGEPWRYSMKRFSFYGATSTPDEDEVLWGIYFDPEFASGTQITDGAIPYDENNAETGWGWFTGFASMEAFECCGETPTAWNWESPDTGTPGASDVCGVAGTAPENQLNICFTSGGRAVEIGENGAAGEKYLNFAFQALEEQLFGDSDGGPTDGFGIDNLELVWEEFYAGDDTGNCAVSGQCGQIAFDLRWYQTDCGGEVATITVVDGNAGDGPLTVTVTSAATGDSEYVSLIKQGSDPVYVGTVIVSTDHGLPPDDGTLFVIPHDSLTATYDDANDGTGSPCTDVALSGTWFSQGSLGIDSRNYYYDNGDNDGFADTQETVTFELAIANNMDEDLTNAVVTIETLSPHVCVLDDTADFGTITAGGTANNPDLERFRFQVNPDYECSDPENPDRVEFIVHVTGDDFCGATTILSTTFVLDVDEGSPAPPVMAGYAPQEGEGSTATRNLLPQSRQLLEFTHYDDYSAGPTALYSATGSESPSTKDTTCGNAYYDDGTSEGVWWYGGGNAGNPDYIFAVQIDPTDFGIIGDYEIDEVCFGDEFNVGVNDNAWYLYPDSAGLPDEATVLAEGVKSTGGGTGQETHAISPAVPMGAGELFWIVVRGQIACCNGLHLITDYSDDHTISLNSYGSTTGVAGLAADSSSDYVMHANLSSTATYLCDTSNNSSLPNNCGLSVDVTPDGTTQACTGSDIVYTANAFSSTGTVSYQWTEDGGDMPGETGATLTVGYGSAQSHTYNCKVSDDVYTDVTDVLSPTGEWIDCAPDIQYDDTFDPGSSLVEVCGDGDAIIEPGEEWDVSLRLINNGTAPATSVTADLGINAASTGDAVVSGGNPGSYGGLAIGGSSLPASPYSFCVDAAATCPGTLTFDVVNISSTEGGYADEVAAFSVSVGETINESKSQVTDPLTARSATAASDFEANTIATADSATVSYTTDYSGTATSSLFGPDDEPYTSGNWTISGGSEQSATHCGRTDSYYRIDTDLSTRMASPVSTVGYTNIHVIFDYTGFSLEAGQGDALSLDWHDGIIWHNDVWTGSINSWQCGIDVALPSGAAGIPNLNIRFRLTSGNSQERAGIDYITIQGDAPAGSWTDSVRVEFNDLTTWQLLKDYGVADTNPYDVTAHYNGPGTYQIRITEQDGGTATMSAGVLNVQDIQCDVDSCCDTAPEVSDDPAHPFTIGKNGSLVDLTFEDVGAYNYNVYVSAYPETLLADPFDVESPNGKHDCSQATSDMGAMRLISGYDVEAGLNPSTIFYLLIGADNGSANGSLGANSVEGDREASSHCVP